MARPCAARTRYTMAVRMYGILGPTGHLVARYWRLKKIVIIRSDYQRLASVTTS